MAEHSTASGPHRTSLTVRNPDEADRVVIDLTESGVDRTHVTTRPLDVAPESDDSFVAGQGKALGAGWIAGFLIGAVLAAVLLAVLYEPPWSSPLAAAATLAVALGAGYIAAGVGFLQAGIARAGEQGEAAASHRASRAGNGAAAARQEARVEVVVDAATEAEARAARQVFSRHSVSE